MDDGGRHGRGSQQGARARRCEGLRLLVITGAIFAAGVACTTSRANLPGETPPPTQPPPTLTIPPTATPTLAPPPLSTVFATPTPRRTFKLGEKIAYQDGWQLTVLKIEDHTDRYARPEAGRRFVAVLVRFDNGSAKDEQVNSFYFKLQDSTGVRRTTVFIASRDDALRSGTVVPGAFVVGSLIFEVPAGDARLQLLYEQLGYAQTTIDLY